MFKVNVASVVLSALLAQMSFAGSVMLEKADQGTVSFNPQPDPPGATSSAAQIIVHDAKREVPAGIMVPDQSIAGVVIDDKELRGVIMPDHHLAGVVVDEKELRGVMVPESIIMPGNSVAGGMMLEKQGIIINEKTVAGGLVLEKQGVIINDHSVAGVMIPDAKLAGSMMVEKHGVVVDKQQVAGGVILERPFA